MMKLVVGTLVSVMLCSMLAATTVQAKGDASTGVISLALPGVGEWINSDFQGAYPFVECIVGEVCFPFMISSVVDAAAGKADRGLRFDFWSAPAK